MYHMCVGDVGARCAFGTRTKWDLGHDLKWLGTREHGKPADHHDVDVSLCFCPPSSGTLGGPQLLGEAPCQSYAVQGPFRGMTSLEEHVIRS